jgi:hypothetical protein
MPILFLSSGFKMFGTPSCVSLVESQVGIQGPEKFCIFFATHKRYPLVALIVCLCSFVFHRLRRRSPSSCNNACSIHLGYGFGVTCSCLCFLRSLSAATSSLPSRFRAIDVNAKILSNASATVAIVEPSSNAKYRSASRITAASFNPSFFDNAFSAARSPGHSRMHICLVFVLT